ncbi:MAG TPA: hypothetical protein VJS37_04580 [Terriglobales bacterium]|nr:hypothetical protein [Terriglobales bacterium]
MRRVAVLPSLAGFLFGIIGLPRNVAGSGRKDSKSALRTLGCSGDLEQAALAAGGLPTTRCRDAEQDRKIGDLDVRDLVRQVNSGAMYHKIQLFEVRTPC